MKIAALYDIHGNLPALEAVLADVDALDVDCIVFGGDVVAGPLPNETLNLIKQIRKSTVFIHGNGESEVLRYLAGEPINALSEGANESAKWVADQLTLENRDFITKWQTTITLETDAFGKILFCHATPQNDIDIFTKNTPDELLIPVFESVGASLVVCGHTHMQTDRVVGDTRVVVAGSVGMPFGHTGADWLLIHDEIQMMHTSYDLESAADRLRNSTDPDVSQMIEGNVLSAPSEDNALAFLTALEAKQREK